MERPYFCAYHSYLEAMEPLNDAERGRLFTACLAYSMTGEAPQLTGNERFVFPSLKGQIDRDKQRFAEFDRKQAENGRKGGRPRKKPKETTEEEESSQKPKEATGLPENPKNPTVFWETQKSQDKEKDKDKDIDKEDDKDSLRSSSSSEKADDDDSPERFWAEAKLGDLSPHIVRQMSEFRSQGIENALIVAALMEAVDHSAKAPWIYAKTIIDQAAASGCVTLTDWQKTHLPRKGNRVDRATPSGKDFLADAMERPFRHHKRRD